MKFARIFHITKNKYCFRDRMYLNSAKFSQKLTVSVMLQILYKVYLETNLRIRINIKV